MPDQGVEQPVEGARQTRGGREAPHQQEHRDRAQLLGHENLRRRGGEHLDRGFEVEEQPDPEEARGRHRDTDGHVQGDQQQHARDPDDRNDHRIHRLNSSSAYSIAYTPESAADAGALGTPYQARRTASRRTTTWMAVHTKMIPVTIHHHGACGSSSTAVASPVSVTS